MAKVQGVNSVYTCSMWENPKPCPPPPLLKVLFDQQLASVRGGTEKALFVDSVAVHSVAKRYAALASSMLLLMAEYDSDETGGCRGGGGQDRVQVQRGRFQVQGSPLHATDGMMREPDWAGASRRSPKSA